MTRLMKGFWLLLLSLLGLHVGVASAATTSVLCNSDIQGDSTNPNAPNCIDVLAWSWGLSAPSPSGGVGTSKASLQEFSFTKYTDSSSEDFFRLVATQKQIGGIVEFRDYGSCSSGCSSTTPYLTIHMKHVVVTSQSMGGSDGDDRHAENISLSFDEISYCFTAAAAGKSPPAQCFAFSIPLNSSITPF